MKRCEAVAIGVRGWMEPMRRRCRRWRREAGGGRRDPSGRPAGRQEAVVVIRGVMRAAASVWPLRSSGDEHGPRMDHTVVLSAIFLAFLLYFNTLKADFAYDDRFVHLSYPLMGGFLDDLIG